MVKGLKPTSSYFLSQVFWRILRKILNKKLWTFFYRLSQKIKMRNLISNFSKNDFKLVENLDYPQFSNTSNEDQKFSHYLNLFKSSKPLGEYRNFLDTIFKDFQIALSNFNSLHGFANSRARLRMTTLYQIAQSNNGLVVGTGNKVEDFGVGFYTKYGDGGVDISPLGDCTKTEVWEMGRELGLIKQIIDAVPTDGLWNDARSDEHQLGLSYENIEEAMKNSKSKYYKKYSKAREPNLHKMKSIPVCKIKRI